MDRKRILVVDDDRFIRRAVRCLIECLGHECLEAEDGEEGCKTALAEKPDLIVLDVMLPKVNGYEVSRMIKEEVRKGGVGKNIPILIVTARRTDSEEREEFLRTWSQADEFIYKPFDLDHLSDRISEFLGAGEACSREASGEEEISLRR
ncbi:MAG: response regulator [Candidatus Eisenbacteria sp.]|nr:response regulator [Candidatus Eisenbacteria bacterium]